MIPHYKAYRQKGFTLVELAIALLIIALMVSGVLVGKELVRSAELRAAITQYQDFTAAIGTFRNNYNGLPGDIKGQADYGFVGDGNQDGVLAEATDLTAGENSFFWAHLGSSGAKLISGMYTGQEARAFPEDNLKDISPAAQTGLVNWGVYGDAPTLTNYFILGIVAPQAAGQYTTSNALSPLDAKSIDEKIDDGMPNKGMINAGMGGAAAFITPDENCASTTQINGVYVTNDKTKANTIACTLRFKMPL
jgi:prepilin-type N-terminal cleavage/methylation domain-containing protein